jgi:hypothetical protein
MSATLYEETGAAEREIARLVNAAAVAFIHVEGSLPLLLNAQKDYKTQYVSRLRQLGSTFTPALAEASRFCDTSIGVEEKLGTSFPSALRRLVSLLEDAFVLFWSVESYDDIQHLRESLPPPAEMDALLTSDVVSWVQEHNPESMKG